MSDSFVSSFSDMFANDPILSKMDDPNILWGDLLLADADRVAPVQTNPKLSRKSIQKKYPVLVRLQPSKTLGIQWRMHKLAEWRAVNPNPMEWKPYEVNVAREMIQDLKNAGWNVYAPTHPSFVCSIGSSELKTGSWTYEEPDCPTLLCLNDIKLFFPVIWHKMDNAKNCKTYSLELYHDKIHSTARTRGVSSDLLTNHLSWLLLTTLAHSPAWNVAESQRAGEHCRLVIV
jgi:hypothetical protein